MKGKTKTTKEKLHILREVEAGKSIAVVCRKNNIAEATFHRWTRPSGYKKIIEAPRLKAVKREKSNGLFPAVVIDNVDPANSGRIKVRIPYAGSIKQGYERWARIATLMAGNNRGTWFIPDVNDEVLVAFDDVGTAGNCYVIGGLWAKTSPPPETMDTNNNKKLLRSRNGVKITLDDESGQESFIVETPGGQKITLKDGPGSVEITDSNGNSVKLGSFGIIVTASAKVTINASQVEISSSSVTVDAGMSKFSGVLQCDTLISNSVVSASYSPGVGNIW
jgi:uncharacterized protein involved in type VI secretion and phage assembly